MVEIILIIVKKLSPTTSADLLSVVKIKSNFKIVCAETNTVKKD